MMRCTLSYRQPKNNELEKELLSLLQKHSGSKLGEFGFNEGRFEILIGFKKESFLLMFKQEIQKNLKYLNFKVDLLVYIPKK